MPLIIKGASVRIHQPSNPLALTGEDLTNEVLVTARLHQWVQLTDRNGQSITGEICWETAELIQLQIGPKTFVVTTLALVTVTPATPPKGRELLMGR